SHLKPCAAAEVRSIVEERRFSAASIVDRGGGLQPLRSHSAMEKSKAPPTQCPEACRHYGSAATTKPKL
ncbi:MAG: hypothetical protein WA676_15465, partial [Candidatus Sulfotelmatobacter sp.]